MTANVVAPGPEEVTDDELALALLGKADASVVSGIQATVAHLVALVGENAAAGVLKGVIDNVTALTSSLTGLSTAVGNISTSSLGAVPTTAVGAASGVAPLGPDQRISSLYLPPVAITDTFVVSSQAAMLALTAERGDIAVRSDLNKSFALRLEPATNIANWQELLTPTDSVLSVDGRTGSISLSDKYLALSGGVLTGPIYSNSTDSQPVQIGNSALVTDQAYFLAAGRARWGYDGTRQVTALQASSGKALIFDTGGYGATFERVRIGSDGKVGIGTNSPQQLLHVSGGLVRVTDADAYQAEISGNRINFFRAGYNYIDSSTVGGAIAFRTSSAASLDTTAMLIGSNGRIGVGTTTPARTLDILGDFRVVSTVDATQAIALSGPNLIFYRQSNNYIDALGIGGAFAFRTSRAAAADTTPLYITSDGRVGISTTSPGAGYALDVAGAVLLRSGLNMNTQRIQGLASPTADADGATKLYVDTLRRQARLFIASATNTAATGALYWSKIATISTTTQYADTLIGLQLIGSGSGQAECSSARLLWRFKQQSALGAAPLVTLFIDDMHLFGPSMVQMTYDQIDASATVVSLWIQCPISYETIQVQELSYQAGNATVQYFSTAALQQAAPTGIIANLVALPGPNASQPIVANTRPAAETTYVLTLADVGRIVEPQNTAANFVTIPPEAVSFAIGTVIEVSQGNTGQTTIAGGTGVTLRAPNGLKISKQWGSAYLRKRASNDWVVTGDMIA